VRWIWIDRFEEFESGRSARAVKCVSLAEDHLHDHLPGFPVMPNPLILEGLAQTGGILLGEVQQFRKVVVLAKVPKVVFHSWARPGDRLEYRVQLLDIQPEGGIVAGTAHVGDRLVAEVEIVFASLNEAPIGGAQADFVIPTEMLRILNVKVPSQPA